MKKTLFLFTVLLSAFVANNNSLLAQSKIRDGSISPSSSLPDSNAILELESNKKGLLLPRVALSARNVAAPLSAHIAGMTVYNTASAGAGINAVSPGYYYNDGNQWVAVGAGVGSSPEPWYNTGTKASATANTDSVYILGPAAIGIDTATARLDVNGNLRVRIAPPSSSTEDLHVVIDSNGYIKRSLNESKALMRGYLKDDFTAGSTATSIYKITGIKEVQDPGSDFDTATATFTAPISGVYHIEITISATNMSTSPNNYVCGIADSSTGDWILRFTVDDQELEGFGTPSIGVTVSFTGIASLTAGGKYYFGVSTDIKLIAMPSGSSGSGIGSFFEIELLKN